MFDEESLKEKLRAIEALYAGAATTGERDAAARARERIAARLAALEGEQQVEWQFFADDWTHVLVVALARRYGLMPYRYRRQRRNTVVLRAPERFFTETFIPEYEAMAKMLREQLSKVTARVVSEVLHPDQSETPVVDVSPRQLEAFSTTPRRGEG